MVFIILSQYIPSCFCLCIFCTHNASRSPYKEESAVHKNSVADQRSLASHFAVSGFRLSQPTTDHFTCMRLGATMMFVFWGACVQDKAWKSQGEMVGSQARSPSLPQLSSQQNLTSRWASGGSVVWREGVSRDQRVCDGVRTDGRDTNESFRRRHNGSQDTKSIKSEDIHCLFFPTVWTARDLLSS